MNFTASTMANLNRTTASRKDLWKSYRESIMESIIDSVSGRTLIIGYGNGNDMDIGEIISKSSEVTIMDIDIASAQNSIHEAWLEKVKFEQCDLNFFSLPENLPEMSTEMLLEFIDSIEFNTLEIIPDYDTVIVSSVFSQLMYNIISSYFYDRMHIIGEKLMEMTQNHMEFVVKFITKHAANGGRIVVWNDLITLPIGEFPKEPESYLGNYVQTYGMAPNIYAHELMIAGSKLIEDEYLEWNFDSQKSFLVRLSILERVG